MGILSRGLLVVSMVAGCGPAPPAATAPADSPPPSVAGEPEAPSVPMNALAARYAAGDAEAVGPLARAIAGYSVEGEPGPGDDAFVEAMTLLRDLGEQGKLREPPLLDALADVFVAFRASTAKAQHRGAFRVLNGVLVAVNAPRWEAMMIERLERPIRSAKRTALRDLIDEVYWQVTAAEVLGHLRSEKAIRPLIGVVLSPFKANVATTAVNALIEIGDPAVDAAKGLLDGSDRALTDYARAEALRSAADADEDVTREEVKRAAERAGQYRGVIVVGNVGTAKAREVLLDALDDGDLTAQQLIAADLYKVPVDEQVVKHFEAIYLRTRVDDELPPDDYAKETLINAAGSFFDEKLNGRIFADGLTLKGDPGSVQAVQATILSLAIKAATKAQWGYVEDLGRKALPPIPPSNTKYFVRAREGAEERGPLGERQVVNEILALTLDGGQVRRDEAGSAWRPMEDEKNLALALGEAAYVRAMKNGKEVLDRCGDDAECFLKVVTDPAANTRETATQAEKAAYMAALLGGPDVTMKLVDLLPRIPNPGAQEIVLYSLLRRSPRGDEAGAAKLQSLVDAAYASGRAAAREEVTPYRQVIERLRTRAR
ncbi:MAG: hypothetical protein R3B72_33580 [Polyangiaceae bacterium]